MSERQQLQKYLGHLDKTVTDKLHSRVAIIQSNDANLAKQTKALHARTQEARKHQDHWNNIVRAGRNGMKVR
jgi:GCN5-like protein 1 (GCN5L1)